MSEMYKMYSRNMYSRIDTQELEAAYRGMQQLRRELKAGHMRLLGLCDAIGWYVPNPSFGYWLVQKCSPSWEHYSGDESYPVPDSLRHDMQPREVYSKNRMAGRLWVGDQRELRIDLLRHIMAQVRSELRQRANLT